MKEQLEYFIRLKLKHPIEEEIKAILEIFQLKTFAKGDVFKDAGKVCKNLGFLIEGSVRHYAIKNNGKEITGRIVQKNNFVTDLISIRTREKTPMIIAFLEPSTMLVTSKDAVDELLEVNLTFNRLIREHMADSVVELGKLYLLFLTGTAKERYQFVLENNPSLLKNIPLQFIATMIGITPTQLSRIRNKKEK